MKKQRLQATRYWMILIGLLFLGAPAYSDLTVELKQVRQGESEGPEGESHFWRVRGQQVRMLAHPDRDLTRSDQQEQFEKIVTAEPDKYHCRFPFKGVASLGGNEYPFVLDSTDLSEQGFDLLYFDRNGDGDLSNEKVIEAVSMERRGYAPGFRLREFPRIDLEIASETGSYPHSVIFQVHSHYHSADEKLLYAGLNIQAAAARVGEVEIEGKTTRIALIDYNSNGVYGDEWSVSEYGDGPVRDLSPVPGDQLLVNPGTDPYFHLGDSTESRPVSEFVQIAGKFFTMQIAPSGERLTLKPVELSTGWVQGPDSDFRAWIFSDENGIFSIYGKAGEKVLVPVGEWNILSYRMILQDEAAAPDHAGHDKLTTVAAHGMSNSKSFRVEKDQSVRLPIGAPFRPEVRVVYVTTDPEEEQPVAYLALDILDADGAKCFDLRIENQRPEKPNFVIASNDGKIIERGNFEYG